MIFELQNNNFPEEPIETVHHPKKIDILFEDLAETENRAKQVLECLDLEGLKQDVKDSKTLLNVKSFQFYFKFSLLISLGITYKFQKILQQFKGSSGNRERNEGNGI